MTSIDPQDDDTARKTTPERIHLVPEVLFALMALACIAIGWAHVWPGYLDHLAREEFLPVPCRVVEARVYRASDNIHWTHDLRYEYVVDGVTYQSERLDFASARSTRSPPSLPAVGPATCHVRTGDPGTSVLRKHIDPATGPIGLGLIVVCLVFLWSSFQFRRMRLKKKRHGRMLAADDRPVSLPSSDREDGR